MRLPPDHRGSTGRPATEDGASEVSHVKGRCDCGLPEGRQARQVPLRQLAISLSHGAKWKVLISRYIGTIPVNGQASCAAEHMSGMPTPWSPVSSAMMAKAGAAASDSKPAALALGHSRPV